MTMSEIASRPAAAMPVRVGAALVVIAALLIWPVFDHDEFLLYVATLVCLYAIGATSLHLMVRTGHVSLCHAAFMGLSAYTCALLVMRLNLPWVAAAVCGVLASAAAGAIVAPVFLRLAGKYFVLVTFMFGEIVTLAFTQAIPITGGANGLTDIPSPYPFLVSKLNFYYFALAISIVCVLFALRLLSSALGRSIDAIGESDVLAEAAGMPVARINRLVFTIACGMVGVQGALQAHYIQYLEPDAFGTTESLNFVVMNVLGGMGSIAGPLLGTVFVIVLPELLRDYVTLQRVIFGICIVVVMAALPGGLVELIERGWRLARRGGGR